MNRVNRRDNSNKKSADKNTVSADIKKYTNPKPWMATEWNDAKHEKWLVLIKEYPTILPFKIGNVIKNCPKFDVDQLRERINHNIATKGENWGTRGRKNPDDIKKSQEKKPKSVDKQKKSADKKKKSCDKKAIITED